MCCICFSLIRCYTSIADLFVFIEPTIIVSTFAVDMAKLDATSAVFIWDWDKEEENDRQKMRGRFKGFKVTFKGQGHHYTTPFSKALLFYLCKRIK